MPECRPDTRRAARRFATALVRDRSGATAIEYGLIAAMIGIALVGILMMAGVAEHQSAVYDILSDAMTP